MVRLERHHDSFDKVFARISQRGALRVGSGQFLNPGNMAFQCFIAGQKT